MITGIAIMWALGSAFTWAQDRMHATDQTASEVIVKIVFWPVVAVVAICIVVYELVAS